MRIRTGVLALAAAATITLTGCSSGSSSDNTAATTTASGQPAPAAADNGNTALTAAVKAYTAKLFDGDASGYNYLSTRCKQQMTKDAWTDLAKQGHQQYGSQKATAITVDQISGDLARVSYGAGRIPQFERHAQPWTREDGTWRWDAC